MPKCAPVAPQTPMNVAAGAATKPEPAVIVPSPANAPWVVVRPFVWQFVGGAVDGERRGQSCSHVHALRHDAGITGLLGCCVEAQPALEASRGPGRLRCVCGTVRDAVRARARSNGAP